MSTYEFRDILEDMDAGIFEAKISRALKDVAIGSVEHGDGRKVGRVVIEITTKQQGESNQVLVTHKLRYEKPTKRGKAIEEDQTATPMWVHGKGLSAKPGEDEQTDLFKTENVTALKGA